MESSGREATKLLDPAGGITIYGWSTDGKRIVYYDGAPIRFSVFDLRLPAGVRHHGAELSPDRRWVTFHLPCPYRVDTRPKAGQSNNIGLQIYR
jgi:hypothetical protein